MLFSSHKALIRKYGDMRLYVTEVKFSRFDEPVKFYLFLTEYNTEVEVTVLSVEKKKAISSDEETMYLLKITHDEYMLLFLDHRRGNHYVFCKYWTYQEVLAKKALGTYQSVTPTREVRIEDTPPPPEILSRRQQRQAEENQPSPIIRPNHPTQLNEKSAAPSMNSNITYADLRNKLIVIDTQVICNQPNLLNQLISYNEIILSPYFTTEIDTYVSSEKTRMQINTTVQNLAQQYPNSINMYEYVDTYSLRDQSLDLSDEHDYLLALAMQQQVTKSQIVIITINEGVTTKARLQGYSVFNPLQQVLSSFTQPNTSNIQAAQTATEMNRPPTQPVQEPLPQRRPAHPMDDELNEPRRLQAASYEEPQPQRKTTHPIDDEQYAPRRNSSQQYDEPQAPQRQSAPITEDPYSTRRPSTQWNNETQPTSRIPQHVEDHDAPRRLQSYWYDEPEQQRRPLPTAEEEKYQQQRTPQLIKEEASIPQKADENIENAAKEEQNAKHYSEYGSHILPPRSERHKKLNSKDSIGHIAKFVRMLIYNFF